MKETIVSFEGVSKKYGTNEVLRDVSFSLCRGECIALTGLNGSGKTTLLKLAAGLARPTRGKVHRLPGVRAEYIPESFPALNLTARRVLLGFGRAEGLETHALTQKTERLLSDFHLSGASDAALRTYSKGMLQKVSVIQALQSGADVLMLDEPLSGQDRQSQETFIQMVGELLRGGTAVLLACHEEHLIRALADRVFLIHQGALRAHELMEDRGQDIYLFDMPDEGFLFPDDLKTACRSEMRGGQLTVTVPHAAGDGMLLKMLQAGCRLREMRHEKSR